MSDRGNGDFDDLFDDLEVSWLREADLLDNWDEPAASSFEPEVGVAEPAAPAAPQADEAPEAEPAQAPAPAAAQLGADTPDEPQPISLFTPEFTPIIQPDPLPAPPESVAAPMPPAPSPDLEIPTLPAPPLDPIPVEPVHSPLPEWTVRVAPEPSAPPEPAPPPPAPPRSAPEPETVAAAAFTTDWDVDFDDYDSFAADAPVEADDAIGYDVDAPAWDFAPEPHPVVEEPSPVARREREVRVRPAKAPRQPRRPQRPRRAPTEGRSRSFVALVALTSALGIALSLVTIAVIAALTIIVQHALG